MRDAIHVRQVKGRYPSDPSSLLRSENIEVTVEETAHVVCLRLDDAENPEMWLEIILELEVPQ